MKLFEVGAFFQEFGFGGGQGCYADPFAGADVVLDLDYRYLVHGLVFQHQHGAFVCTAGTVKALDQRWWDRGRSAS